MESQLIPARYAQTSANTAELLRETLGLFLVHIIPAEIIGRDAWEQDGDRFSLELGKASAEFFAREFDNAVSLGDYKNGRLQIGVAGGRTVFGLFNALPQFPKREGLQVEVLPLVTGPMPLSIYSASSVAELAVQKFSRANVPSTADIRLRDGHFELLPIRLDPSEIAELDWLVLGIGGIDSGSLKNHFASINEYDEEVRTRTIGDICSRLFDTGGREVGRDVSDEFVRVQLTDLANLARQGSEQITRVVAVAGGKDKVSAMAAILGRRPRLINFLVTDELTARAIIRKLRLRVPKEAGFPQAGLEQIPVSVLREHHGKWILWDQAARSVLGVGETLEDAEEQAKGTDKGRVLRIHHALWTEDMPTPTEV